MARSNGVWGKEKLAFLDQYLPPALRATSSKLQRYYIDLFAGPGRNVDKTTGEEFEGGAIRALKISDGRTPPTAFTHMVCCNLDPDDHGALSQRVGRIVDAGGTRIPRSHIRLIEGDANSHVEFIMNKIDQRAYVVVFAEPDNPSQLPFSTIEALRTRGHSSVDLYVLYPSHMALRRLLGDHRTNERVLNRFYGDMEWEKYADKRITSAQFPQLSRDLREHYMLKIRALGWTFVHVAKPIRRNGSSALYDMIFATSHPAGEKIGSWASRRDGDGQISMF